MEFVVQLGAALIRAGTAVDEVQATLLSLADQFRLGEANIVVLPTAVLVQPGQGAPARSLLVSFRRTGLRLDQISSLDDLTRSAERGEISAAEGLDRLAAIDEARPPRSAVVRVFGMGVLSTGLRCCCNRARRASCSRSCSGSPSACCVWQSSRCSTRSCRSSQPSPSVSWCSSSQPITASTTRSAC